MDKDLLRRDFILKRKSLAPKIVNVKSRKVFENFKICDFKKVIKKMLVYLPLNKEVETRLIIEYLKQNKIDMFIPAFRNGKWVISEFVNENELIAGSFGTRQPIDLNVAVVDNLDLVIVPGVAFSNNGFRLGYGKGVYDRLLEGSRALKVGLAYDFQLTNFKVEPHDIKMDVVVTEEKIVRVLQ